MLQRRSPSEPVVPALDSRDNYREEEEEEGMALPEGGLIENTHLEILERARKTFARVLVFSVSDVARRTLARFPAGLVLKINYGLTENR